jgi:hypothetical protein
MEPIGRFFLCACCQRQTVICSSCDRGQIYCSPTCAESMRCACLREAGRRYQQSERGRANHARRMVRYRAKSATGVTHQGPVSRPDEAALPVDAPQRPSSRPPVHTHASSELWRCQVCQCACAAFVRLGFLHTRRKVGVAPTSACKPPCRPSIFRQGRFEPSEGEVAR